MVRKASLNMYTWAFIALSLSLGIVPVRAARNVFLDEVHDLRKTVEENAKLIRSLTEKLMIQNRQIQTLETRLSNSAEERLSFAARIDVLEGFVVGCNNLSSNEVKIPNIQSNIQSKTLETNAKRNEIRRIATPGIIAFYAYMSHTEVNPGPLHTIIFDVTVTNAGRGYNHFSGIFSVPESGVYVFSWTIADSQGGYVFSELVVNNDVIGCILTQTYVDTDRISTTGLVVKDVSDGDVVYVRTSPTGGIHGDIQSLSPVQRTSFSGWKLA